MECKSNDGNLIEEFDEKLLPFFFFYLNRFYDCVSLTGFVKDKCLFRREII